MTALGFIALAALGTLIRFWIARLNTTLPIGTFIVNVIGSFVLGLTTSAIPDQATLLGTALLGSFTTFSTLANETVTLNEGGARRAVGYLGITLAAGVLAAWLGLEIGA